MAHHRKGFAEPRKKKDRVIRGSGKWRKAGGGKRKWGESAGELETWSEKVSG